MTQNTAKMKINEVAKEVARSSKDSLSAIAAMQKEISSRIESAKKVESELIKRTREEERQQKEAVRSDVQATAPAEAKAAVETPSDVKAPEKKVTVVTQPVAQPQTPQATQVQQSAPAQERKVPVVTPPQAVEKAEEKQPAQRPSAPQEQRAEQTPQQSPQQPSAPAPAPKFERPAERLARMQGRVLRDDAAIRNAQRAKEEAARRGNAPQQRTPYQRDGQRMQGDRSGRPGGYQQRDGQRPQGDRTGRPGGFQQRSDNQRSFGGNRQGRSTGGSGVSAAIAAPANKKAKVSNYDPNRSSYVRVFDNEKKNKSRKALERERRAQLGGEDEYTRYGRRPKRKHQQQQRPEPIKIEKAVITGETVTVKTLADRIGKPATDIIKKLMMLGVIATINNEIDYDTAALVASDFGVELEQKLQQTAEDVLTAVDQPDSEDQLVKRPPVVTIMGHVDHGKTSLLDKIRSTRVTAGEAGGITQHIGAYCVECNGETITFLDTPGHEAFTAMRARGAQVTDAVILVVAANDGIKPQTVEAINHAKAAEVPIIVAINKIDLPEANIERVRQELTEHGLVWEEWGGDTVIVPVSAKTGEGIENLLEMILLVTEVQELRANPDRLAKGTIVEAKLDKGRGPVATVLVQNGTLRVGQTVVAGTASGRVRAMLNDAGERVETAGPSMPVEILGFDYVPEAGDILYAVEDGALTRQVVEERKAKIKSEQMKMTARVSLDDLFEQISEGEIKDLNVIVKADVQGSVEAVRSSLEKLSNDQVRVRCIHGGAGAIVVSDVMLASASNAIIIGFNVRPDGPARIAAERENVDIRLYRVIYNAIEDIEKAMKGLLEPVFEEVSLGTAEVRETFKVSAIGTIAGCMVQSGKMVRNASVRLLRDNVVIYEGKLASLKRFKDDVREVASGYECGLSLQNYNDIKEGDIIEAFTEQEVEQ